jgi:hypothetical protein
MFSSSAPGVAPQARCLRPASQAESLQPASRAVACYLKLANAFGVFAKLVAVWLRFVSVVHHLDGEEVE